ncbi:MAG TPA: glycosyltransferase family 4 protein [Candidatus Didemnitutus sp.]|nr:glycosyltransferase family 4 protein [Candidatus Didemnitutus sp.]
MAAARTADECLALAGTAEQQGQPGLANECLARSIALDRNCQAALLMLAGRTWELGDAVSTYVLLEETRRAGMLPTEVEALLNDLKARFANEAGLENYRRAIGAGATTATDRPLGIVLVTNLFPPQELGGYGRMMWEFAHGLIARGHRVRVLTSTATEFGKAPTADEVAMEAYVDRSLQLHGTWVGGRPAPVTDRAELVRRITANSARLRRAIDEVKPDLVLAGNIDFFGVSILQSAFQARVPVLHALANASPGFSVAEQPREGSYWVAPCSRWNGDIFRQNGFTPARLETLYPGARIDRFFRFFLPDVRRLRICYASLVLPYKGADTLVDALGRLHEAGVDFTAEIAGDGPDANFLADLRARIAKRGMDSKVTFTGFLDRHGLASLFARSNVLVFPSVFNEPFGISQVEALASGLVVVSSGTGGAKEIIRDGVDGLQFAAGNSAHLAEQLTRLARDPALMASLQKQGQARAAQFSVEQAVLTIERLAAGMLDAQMLAGLNELAPLMGA